MCRCGHPLAWHGDRAVAACYGTELGMRPAMAWTPGKLSYCACTGWHPAETLDT